MQPRFLPILTGILLGAACAGPTDEPAGDESPAGLENGAFTAELNGFEIHYEVHGTGPVLMTVPNSWGLSVEGLRGFYRPLEDRVTLVYFDPRGIGRSAAIREEADMGPDAVRADFDALRRHLGLDKVAAIGWSNGASNLILLAAEHPETIEAAVFVHGAARFLQEDMEAIDQGRFGELFQAFGAFQQEMAQSPDLTDAERDAKAKHLMTEIWFPQVCADPEQAAVTLPALYADTDFSYAHSQYTQSVWPTFDARDKLPSITARALVIAGRHDMLPPENAQILHDGLNDSTWSVFEESGHFAPVEEPERFRREVLEFLGVAG
jgi:proline iminopeptidase